MNAADYEVGIVGAGPCGLLTALLLARQGVRCALFERRAEPLLHPRAMAISRRSAEIFQQLGLREAMRAEDRRAAGQPVGAWMESFTGEVYGVIPRADDDPALVPYPGIHCPQTLTESVLLGALEQEVDASIFFDHEVTGLVDVGNAVSVLTRRAGLEKELDLSCEYVVAADGAGSPARRALGIDAVGPGDLGSFLNVFFRAPYAAYLKDRAAVLTHVLRKDFFELFVAVNGDDLWLMHHFLRPGETPADFPPAVLAEIVKLAAGLPAVPVDVLGVSPWVMSPKVAVRFREGRAFLTGDAAARLSPSGGLGMNTGLQSAHNLAWKLSAVLRGAPAALLDSYDAERRTQVMRTFERSASFGSEIGETIAAGLAEDFARVRELVAGSRRRGSGLGLDLGWSYERGAFIPDAGEPGPRGDDDAYFPDAAPGRRAPHVLLEGPARTFSTLDLFGASFVLLVAGNAAPWRAGADATTRFAGFYLEIFSVGREDGYGDPEGRFLALYGLNPGGAVLVRPDGVVGWRSRDGAPSKLVDALTRILAGG